MASLKINAKTLAGKRRAGGRLPGRQLALILRKLDSADDPAERKRLRREFMRGFYGDKRADRHA